MDALLGSYICISSSIINGFSAKKIPSPDEEDFFYRSKRVKMFHEDRYLFIKNFFPGITPLVFVYVFLTLFRDLRDNFAVEFWNELLHSSHFDSAIFAKTEILISICILLIIAALVLVRNNNLALLLSCLLIILGFVVIIISSWLFKNNLLSPFNWMLFTGLGLYLGYIPYNCVLYDRLIACLKKPANVGFLMYLSDAFGYFVAFLFILLRLLFANTFDWLYLFRNGIWYFSFLGIFLIIFSFCYFLIIVYRKRF